MIRTKYLGPTDTRGARIKAWSGETSVTIPYPYELNTEDAHTEAASKLAESLARWQRGMRSGVWRGSMMRRATMCRSWRRQSGNCWRLGTWNRTRESITNGTGWRPQLRHCVA